MVEIKLSEKNFSKKIDAVIEKGESVSILISGYKAKIIKKGIIVFCKLNFDKDIFLTGTKKKGNRFNLFKVGVFVLLNPSFWGFVVLAINKGMTLDYNESTEGLMVLLQNSSKGPENTSD